MPEQKPIDPPQSNGGIKLTLEVGQPWRVVSWALFIFIMGMIAGASALHLWRPKPPRDRVESPLPRDFSQRLQRDLDLSNEQAAEIETIVAKYEPLFRQTSDEARTKLREDLEKMNQEILPVLDDYQREIHRDQWRRMLKPPREHHRPPPRKDRPFKPHNDRPPPRHD